MALTALAQRCSIKFIVAYQTISDYLDNLCDRSSSLDPQDFAALHESMGDALSVERSQSSITAIVKIRMMGDIYMN